MHVENSYGVEKGVIGSHSVLHIATSITAVVGTHHLTVGARVARNWARIDGSEVSLEGRWISSGWPHFLIVIGLMVSIKKGASIRTGVERVDGWFVEGLRWENERTRNSSSRLKLGWHFWLAIFLAENANSSWLAKRGWRYLAGRI